LTDSSTPITDWLDIGEVAIALDLEFKYSLDRVKGVIIAVFRVTPANGAKAFGKLG